MFTYGKVSVCEDRFERLRRSDEDLVNDVVMVKVESLELDDDFDTDFTVDCDQTKTCDLVWKHE